MEMLTKGNNQCKDQNQANGWAVFGPKVINMYITNITFKLLDYEKSA